MAEQNLVSYNIRYDLRVKMHKKRTYKVKKICQQSNITLHKAALCMVMLLVISCVASTIYASGIEVKAEEHQQEHITGLSLDFKEETLNIGDCLTLNVTIQYSDQTKMSAKDTEEKLIFSSSNSSVASVQNEGKITAKAPGQATIKVKTTDGAYSASLKITVKKPYLTQTSLTIYTGETFWLYVKNGNGKITWKSSKPSVAQVSAKGKVTGLSTGEATITVTRSGISMKCKVIVKKVRISKSTLNLYQGQSYKLSIIRTQKQVKWSSSNTKVATVSAKGTVIAKSSGKVTITATVDKKKYICTVKVKASNLLIGKLSATLDTKGKHKIPVTCLTKDWKNIVWEVSNPNVIEIMMTDKNKTSANLTLLAKSKGTTELRIYRKAEPKDVKVVKITVTQDAISEKPKLAVTMSADTVKSTKTGSMTLQNLGTKKLTVKSVAYSYDFDYSGYDRVMKLIDSDRSVFLSSQSISAGKKQFVVFQMEGKKTWYDRKTKYYFYIRYDGLDYEVITSQFLGTTIRLL